MRNKSKFMITLLSFFVLSLITGMNGQLLGQAGTVVSKFGQAQVAGRNVIVHVTVVVPPGANANQVALDAIAIKGLGPFSQMSSAPPVWPGISS